MQGDVFVILVVFQRVLNLKVSPAFSKAAGVNGGRAPLVAHRSERNFLKPPLREGKIIKTISKNTLSKKMLFHGGFIHLKAQQFK